MDIFNTSKLKPQDHDGIKKTKEECARILDKTGFIRSAAAIRRGEHTVQRVFRELLKAALYDNCVSADKMQRFHEALLIAEYWEI